MAELEQLNSRIEVETVGIDVTSARLNFGLPLVQVCLIRLLHIRYKHITILTILFLFGKY